MDRNLLWKLVLIVALVLVAFVELYPPSKTLIPGLDLAGGTSFIYELDTQGLKPEEQRGLAERTIEVLRKRIDPTNTKNLIWRSLGNNRLEIQVPLASKEAREKRAEYEAALEAVQANNVNLTAIMRSLDKPAQARSADFEKYAGGSKDRLEILNSLASAYDQRKALAAQRNELSSKLSDMKKQLETAGVIASTIDRSFNEWQKLSAGDLAKKIDELVGDKKDNAKLVNDYYQTYSQWAKVVNGLTDPQQGANAKFTAAINKLDQININIDQLLAVLEMPANSQKRTEALGEMKTSFADKAEKIDQLTAAFDNYRQLRGRLDDPEDLRRMLKGSGVLGFRILPKVGDGKISQDEIQIYQEALKNKGPKQASDDKYVWVAIENMDEWNNSQSIMGEFANKNYVLASNKPSETMLHSTTKPWRLTGSRPTSDDMGRMAIGFTFDEVGGNLFYNLTKSNIGRPLAILLDNAALSAPNINSAIRTNGIIEGSFTNVQIEDMVNKLNAGSLPARLIEPPLSIKSIGPSIGAENRDAGIKAGIIGLGAVLLFMIVYYSRSGFIADIALVMNLLFVLAIMALSRATFTLPGIAGIILTIGMAVDANVLIHERIREEQEKGSSLRVAIKNGYDRAFTTIFDSNLTTILSAVVLYLVASEELKGFAITLILGLASSMFTAVFVTRVCFEILLDRKILRDKLSMMKIIGVPKVDWMKARPVFLTISAIMITLSMYAFFSRDKSKYDIEFTGGTSAQINLKPGIDMDRNQAEKIIQQVGREMGSSGLAAAKVTSIGTSNRQYEITTTATNKTSVVVTFAAPGQSADSLTAQIEKVEPQFNGQLTNLEVRQDPKNPARFEVTTSQINKGLVSDILAAATKGQNASVSTPQVNEVVQNALAKAFGDVIETQRDLGPSVVSVNTVTTDLIASNPELANYVNGVAITVKLTDAASISEIETRLKDLRFKPQAQEYQWYGHEILSGDFKQVDPNAAISQFVYVTALPEAGFRQISPEEQNIFTDSERSKIVAAAAMESSLPRMTQIDPSLGSQAQVRGLVAIILSFFAIIVYVWVRFGASRYGFAGVLALVHDVIIATGAVVISVWVSQTIFGKALLIGDFKINLDIIAALLTIIGFSINDTIVIFDRIRENRGRGGILTPEMINLSINQTMSRTILTTTTAFTVVLVMYIWGGSGLRGFTFTMLVGMIAGTYSTIAIAAPIVLWNKKAQKVQ